MLKPSAFLSKGAFTTTAPAAWGWCCLQRGCRGTRHIYSSAAEFGRELGLEAACWQLCLVLWHRLNQPSKQSCHENHPSDSSHKAGDKSTAFLLLPGCEGKRERKTRYPSRFANPPLNKGIEHIPQ